MNKLSVIDFFCGGSGFSEGFRQRERVIINQAFKSSVVKASYSLEHVYYTVKNQISDFENKEVGYTSKVVSVSTLKSITVFFLNKEIVSKYTQYVEAIFKRQDNLEIEN